MLSVLKIATKLRGVLSKILCIVGLRKLIDLCFPRRFGGNNENSVYFE
jgi:hypothetical protein